MAVTWTRAYFLVLGIFCVGAGLGAFFDVHGWGRRWERDVNQLSAHVNKIARLPWPPNPRLGAVWRPVVAGFMTLVGVALVVAVGVGAIR